MIIRRVGPLSCAKIAGALYALIGLLFGGVLSLVSLTGAFGSARGTPPALFGAAAVVILPVLYGCMGFVMTLISAWLYNLLAASVGGIQIDLGEVDARG